MKKIRKICLQDKQVMKKEEMSHVVAGDESIGQWQCAGCNCKAIGDRDVIWREVEAPSVNWNQLATGVGQMAGAAATAYTASYTIGGALAVEGAFIEFAEGWSNYKSALNSYKTETVYSYRQLNTLTPIKTHIYL